MAPKNFGPKNFFGPKILFDPKYFVTDIILGTLIFLTDFFEPRYILKPKQVKVFFISKYLGFDLNFVRSKICLSIAD